MKQEYLNEEKYQESNAKVKKIAKILLIVGGIILLIGIIMSILGLFSFGNIVSTATNSVLTEDANGFGIEIGNIIGSFGLFGVSSVISFIGIVLLIIGGILMFISHRREITSYTVQSQIPIAQEGIEKMTPSVGKAGKEIAKGITEGIKEANKKSE